MSEPAPQNATLVRRVTAPLVRGARRIRERLRQTSLSLRVLILTVLYVMVIEIVLYVPGIAEFRRQWLEQRLNAALIATLVVDATPDPRIPETVRTELLTRAGVRAISRKQAEKRALILEADPAVPAEAYYDLNDSRYFDFIAQALETLAVSDRRFIRVAGTPEMAPARLKAAETGKEPTGEMPVLDIVIDETSLRQAMLSRSWQILYSSLAIAFVTAIFLNLSLHGAFVRPIRRLIRSMAAFRTDPEDASRVIVPSGRHDELGSAEQALAAMQEDVRTALQQKSRLAALGTAVSKINHDLRNMLASAQLFSDRVAVSADPVVQAQLPKLMRAIDRAIQLTTDTLRFGRAEEPAPRPRRFVLADLVDEVAAALPPHEPQGVRFINRVDRSLELDADPDQVYRILFNLARNGIEALCADTRTGAVVIEARRETAGGGILIEVKDDGPGIPERVRSHLFEPFASGRSAGGTGLGLAISRELARAHGGDVSLIKSDQAGTIFRITLPDRAHFH